MATRYLSPLRYPGGKATMGSWLAELFARQYSRLPLEIWIEPFAGGAGAALTLLERDAVAEAWITDANPGIAAFWRSVVANGAAMAARIERTTVTMALWEKCREMLDAPRSVDAFELGYAAFIVNRCSRSGIVAVNAGPMGGRTQSGRWTLGSRFNAGALAERVRRVHELGQGGRLVVTEGDGIGRIEDLNGSGIDEEVFVFADPPYLREGNRLYAAGMSSAEHARLANALNASSAHWTLTYDDEAIVPEVLYPERRVLEYSIRNTANRARVAREFAVFSPWLEVDLELATPVEGQQARWVREQDALHLAAGRVGATPRM